MDPMIKRRMIHDIVITPYQGMEDGDLIYGDTYTIKGYACDVESSTINRSGEKVKSSTTIYFDGKYAGKLSDNDEMQTPFRLSRPVLSIAYYPGINCPYELVVVKL